MGQGQRSQADPAGQTVGQSFPVLRETGARQTLEEVEGQGQQGVEERQRETAHDDDLLGVPEAQHVGQAGDEAGSPRAGQGARQQVHRHSGSGVQHPHRHFQRQEHILPELVDQPREIEEQEAVELQVRGARAEVVGPDRQLAVGYRAGGHLREADVLRLIPAPREITGAEVIPDGGETAGREQGDRPAFAGEHPAQQGRQAAAAEFGDHQGQEQPGNRGEQQVVRKTELDPLGHDCQIVRKGRGPLPRRNDPEPRHGRVLVDEQQQGQQPQAAGCSVELQPPCPARRGPRIPRLARIRLRRPLPVRFPVPTSPRRHLRNPRPRSGSP